MLRSDNSSFSQSAKGITSSAFLAMSHSNYYWCSCTGGSSVRLTDIINYSCNTVIKNYHRLRSIQA
jgi:hypothetical protein